MDLLVTGKCKRHPDHDFNPDKRRLSRDAVTRNVGLPGRGHVLGSGGLYHNASGLELSVQRFKLILCMQAHNAC